MRIMFWFLLDFLLCFFSSLQSESNGTRLLVRMRSFVIVSLLAPRCWPCMLKMASIMMLSSTKCSPMASSFWLIPNMETR
jgi:hypothetical protein